MKVWSGDCVDYWEGGGRTEGGVLLAAKGYQGHQLDRLELGVVAQAEQAATLTFIE